MLGWSLAAGGVAVVGGAAGLWGLRGRAEPVSGLRCLSAHEYRTLSHLAEALIPEGGAFPLGAAGLDLARAFDGYLAEEPEWAQVDAKRALGLLEYGPVLFERRLSTFSNLGAGERLAHFERWGESSSPLRRQVAIGFRRFLNMMFYDSPGAWPHLGYDGPLLPSEAE